MKTEREEEGRCTPDAYLVAILKVKVTGFGMVAEVNTLPIVSDDVLCSGILVLSPGNKFMHPARGQQGTRVMYSP